MNISVTGGGQTIYETVDIGEKSFWSMYYSPPYSFFNDREHKKLYFFKNPIANWFLGMFNIY